MVALTSHIRGYRQVFLSQVRNVSYAHLLNQTLKTLHGMPQSADM
jgi:hypothetical protein